MELSIRHSLGMREASSRMNRLFNKLQEQERILDLKEEGDVVFRKFSFKSPEGDFTFSGHWGVTDYTVEIVLDKPSGSSRVARKLQGPLERMFYKMFSNQVEFRKRKGSTFRGPHFVTLSLDHSSREEAYLSLTNPEDEGSGTFYLAWGEFLKHYEPCKVKA